MKEDIVNFLKDKIVQSVFIKEENDVRIKFENSDKCLQLYADQDCCSESWFEILKQEYDTMIGKVIKNIETTDYIEMECSNRQDCDQNQKVQIQFENCEDVFQFVLRNSSNGYYSGWLELRLLDC